MPNRLVIGGLVAFAACGNSPHDQELVDSGSILTDAGIETDADPDAVVIDAAPDAPAPDVTPPAVASVSPAMGAPIWLHAPIRITFDEPLDPASVDVTVTATLAGAAVPAQIEFAAPSSLVVTLPANARGVGALDIAVAGAVADLAGNVQSAPLALSFMAPPWSITTQDRGAARSAPELAVTGDGTVYAAWLVGAMNDRRAVVSALSGDTWSTAGNALGASNVSSVALALDGSAPLVAWCEAGQAHVARWTGAWTELASPGPAQSVALASPPTGAPMVALFGPSTVGVRALAGASWQPIGSDITLASAVARTPSLVALAAGRPAVGWIDAANQLRVYRFDSAWTTITPIAVSAGSRMSLAARGTSLAIAWDQLAGSYGVLAAQLTGAATTWTRLGRALDIDILGDAIAPAIAYDASGAPVVAWTELVETDQRGALARWTGSAWRIVGGVTWLDTTSSRTDRTRLVLHAGEAAIAATTVGTQIRVSRLNGPRVAAVGLSARAPMAGCSYDIANPPAQLSQTGCFDLSTPNRPVPHPGLVPFDVVSELWSDGAKKRRYLGVPDGATMTLQSNGSWLPPPGTLIIKQFDLETTPGDPTTRRPVETRFLVMDATTGLNGFTYRWNAAGTNASLLPDSASTFNWPMDDGSQHAHFYPSRAHCRSCHHSSMGPLLGVRSEQLARWFDYDGVIADQLQTLSALGIAPVSSAQPVVSAHDPGQTVERRMRGYMVGNCEHCHNPLYVNVKDFRYATPLAQTRICETITPGSPSTSRVYQLVTSRPGMPALGSLAVDPLAAQVLGDWISGMTSCP